MLNRRYLVKPIRLKKSQFRTKRKYKNNNQFKQQIKLNQLKNKTLNKKDHIMHREVNVWQIKSQVMGLNSLLNYKNKLHLYIKFALSMGVTFRIAGM